MDASLLLSAGLSHELIERYATGEECSFWFIKASKLRELLATPGAMLPQMESLRYNGARKTIPY